MFKQSFIILGHERCTLQVHYTFQEESCLHQRVLFSILSCCLGCISHYVLKKWWTNLKQISCMPTYIMCSSYIYQISCKGDMYYFNFFNGLLCHLERNGHVEGSTHFKEMHHFCQGNRLTCLNMCPLNVLTQQCQYQHILVLKTDWPNMLLHRLLACVEKRTKIECPNPCPKALSFPQWFVRGKELGHATCVVLPT